VVSQPLSESGRGRAEQRGDVRLQTPQPPTPQLPRGYEVMTLLRSFKSHFWVGKWLQYQPMAPILAAKYPDKGSSILGVTGITFLKGSPNLQKSSVTWRGRELKVH